jgi:predicted membrane channel-forming protein YqfA (hemolysin III family)
MSLQITEVSSWYLCNPYVIKGYRAPMSLWKSLLSVFQWHNETLNIHTHLWPALFFLRALIRLPYSHAFQEGSLEARFVMIFGFTGAVYCLFTSTFFHIVQNVSETWFRISHKLDIIGIIVVCLGQQFLNTLILINSRPFSFWFITGNQAFFAAICIQDILKKREAKEIWAMRYPAMTTVTTIVITVFTDHHRAAVYASACCSVLVIIAGLVFFKGRCPERCLKNMDNYNSHVWHHVCIVIGIYFATRATRYVGGL